MGRQCKTATQLNPPVQLPVLIVLCFAGTVLASLPLHSTAGHHICILVLAAHGFALLVGVGVPHKPCAVLAAAEAVLHGSSASGVLGCSPATACVQYMHAHPARLPPTELKYSSSVWGGAHNHAAHA